jgi:hypothetical protein
MYEEFGGRASVAAIIVDRKAGIMRMVGNAHPTFFLTTDNW